jgi:hypothetical protein
MEDVMLFLDEDLAPERMAEMREHLAACPKCIEQYRDLVGFDEELRTAWKVPLSEILPKAKSSAVNPDKELRDRTRKISMELVNRLDKKQAGYLSNVLDLVVSRLQSSSKPGEVEEPIDAVAALSGTSEKESLSVKLIVLVHSLLGTAILKGTGEELAAHAERLSASGFPKRLVGEVLSAIKKDLS